MSGTTILGLVFGFVGFVLGALALFFLIRTRAFIGRSRETKATVTQMVFSSDSDGGGGYSPVYRFRTLEGQEIEAGENLRTNPPQFKVGQTIDVLYDPDNPQKARIKKWFNLYFLPALLGFLGLLFGGIGIAVMIASAFGLFN
jgi:hypothetical protein